MINSSNSTRIWIIISVIGWSAVGRGDLVDDIDQVPPAVPKEGQPTAPTPLSPVPPPKDVPIGPLKPPPAPSTVPAEVKPPRTQTHARADRNRQRHPIEFNSRGLKGSKALGIVELMEEVVITQGDLKLTSDHATIYYDLKTETVTKVFANGNVHILSDPGSVEERIKAHSEEAEFDNQERNIYLRRNARLDKGENEFSGDEITYELDTGWVRADRVRGRFKPESEKL